MIEEQLAYTAGFIDGEGSIQIRNKKNRHQHSVRMEVKNTNLDVLMYLKNLFGGSIQCRIYQNKNHKQAYSWTLSNLSAVNFLKSILPFLRIKKSQAELAIEFQSTVIGRGRRKIPENIFKIRDDMFLQMKELNRRGNIRLELIN